VRIALYKLTLGGVEDLPPEPFEVNPGPEWVRVSEWVEVDFPPIKTEVKQ